MNNGHKLSMDEILAIVTEIARDPESGADRFRALKMLATTGDSNAAISPPLSHDELVARVARVIHGVGLHIAQLAFHQAFPTTKANPLDSPQLDTGDLTEAEREMCAKVRTLKVLYRKFPEVKRNGFPPGYPVGKGLIAQTAFCQNMAIKAMVDRKQKQHLERAKEASASDVIADSIAGT